ncbi:MAG: hypothetical protein ACPL25_03775 [Ignavibacteria bacterium]
MKLVRLVLQFTFISMFVIVSCSKKDEKKPETTKFIDSLIVKKLDPVSYSDSILQRKILFAYYDDSLKSMTGIFVEQNYGIGFFILNPFDATNPISFKSSVLDGISDGSETDTIKFENGEKFIYYNSGSAFVGSSNIEVYQYLFLPKEKVIYSSYTSLDENGIVEMTYSQNLKDKSKQFIVDFFKSKIQADFIEDLAERKIKIKYE